MKKNMQKIQSSALKSPRSNSLHVAELNVPMISIEFVTTRPKDQIEWYKRQQLTTWVIITEGFSERVIVPEKTTTEVLKVRHVVRDIKLIMPMGCRMVDEGQDPAAKLHDLVDARRRRR